jgi:DNA-binding CsgD family transcriptional regulator
MNPTDPTARDILRVAPTVCTPKELEVVHLKAEGKGYRRIALELHIQTDTARARWERARLKIRRALQEDQAA